MRSELCSDDYCACIVNIQKFNSLLFRVMLNINIAFHIKIKKLRKLYLAMRISDWWSEDYNHGEWRNLTLLLISSESFDMTHAVEVIMWLWIDLDYKSQRLISNITPSYVSRDSLVLC